MYLLETIDTADAASDLDSRSAQNIRNILLVEDNPADAKLTAKALSYGGLKGRLYVVQDGVEALEFLHSEGGEPKPDMILLDLNLPRKNGREVLAEVKQDQRLAHIPVIVLSTSEAEQDVQQCYALHANCYVKKPMSFGEFKKVAQTLAEFWLNTASLPSPAAQVPG